MQADSSSSFSSRTCRYCGLVFSGSGYRSGDRAYCCYGCYLVERILGVSGEEAMATGLVMRLGLGTFLAMNVMMLSIVLYVHSPQELGADTVRALRWAMLALSTPTVILLGGPFVLAAVRDLARGRLSTDALIASGSITAFAASAVHVLGGSGHIYFDTATMLLVIVTLGRLMEASAKTRTSRTIRELVQMTPAVSRALRDSAEVEIASQDLRVGDVAVVRPGEAMPADGQIISGRCLVEEAAFTGEAAPRSCAEGDSVYGGSVNCDGLVQVRISAPGEESMIARIAEVVRQAQQERAPVERLVERIASVFVPLVWALALASGAYWGWLRGDMEQAWMSALAVLVVACPCALGLATPMATCLALGRAARQGVLVRSGEVLERLPGLQTVFFDKTGTLTSGRLAVSEVRVASGVTGDEALVWSAALESASEHAIGNALTAAAVERGLDGGIVTEFSVIPGCGVVGDVTVGAETRRVTVGSLPLLLRDHRMGEGIDPESGDSSTAAWAGWDGRVMASFSLADETRPEAAQCISRLEALGLRSVMVSGDGEAPVRRLAESIGISECFSGCLPEDKMEIVAKARQSSKGEVAMVGDGINDAPALAQADVGIAIGGGTDLARECSDVTLLGDDLLRIPWVLELSRKAYAIIRQNLAWAFGYNAVAISLTFFGYVHPLIAAIAMFASSICVITNSLRLSSWRASGGGEVLAEAAVESPPVTPRGVA